MTRRGHRTEIPVVRELHCIQVTVDTSDTIAFVEIARLDKSKNISWDAIRTVGFDILALRKNVFLIFPRVNAKKLRQWFGSFDALTSGISAKHETLEPPTFFPWKFIYTRHSREEQLLAPVAMHCGYFRLMGLRRFTFKLVSNHLIFVQAPNSQKDNIRRVINSNVTTLFNHLRFCCIFLTGAIYFILS